MLSGAHRCQDQYFPFRPVAILTHCVGIKSADLIGTFAHSVLIISITRLGKSMGRLGRFCHNPSKSLFHIIGINIESGHYTLSGTLVKISILQTFNAQSVYHGYHIFAPFVFPHLAVQGSIGPSGSFANVHSATSERDARGSRGV